MQHGGVPGSPLSPKDVPGGELLLAVPSAVQPLLTQQHTPCVNARQLLPQPLFAHSATLFAFRGITMEGDDGLSAAGKWGKAAPGTCPKDPPASQLLQPLCRLLSSCNSSARPKLNPPQSSRSYRKMHWLPHNLAATQPGKLFIIISLQHRYGKKAPALPRCKQQQLQLPCRDLCTSQCKVHQEKNSIQVLKKTPHEQSKTRNQKKKWLRK